MACSILENVLDEDSRFVMMIDGTNLYRTARALDFDIDYRLLLQVCAQTARLVRASCYTALSDGEEPSPLLPFIDWLGYNGYSVVTKSVKEITAPIGRRRYNGNMDVELAIDAIEMAPTLDHLILFSGDGAFRRTVEAVQKKGVRVSVVSTLKTQSPMIANKLRRQADNFVELQKFAPWIARERQATAMPDREGVPRPDVSSGHTEV